MMYLKLSIRNAKRSFIDYLLYVVTMTVLLAVIEVSNCITIIGESAGFQVISLPLLIAVIQIVLVGYIETFMLKQRAKEFASYLLLGMEKKGVTRMFLCEILLIGFCCYMAGTTIGFSIYGFWYFREPLYEVKHCGFLYDKSMFYTFLSFCLVETVCSFRLKQRLDKLQIRELMYERNRNQGVKNIRNYKKWGVVFSLCFACFIGCICSIVFCRGAFVTGMLILQSEFQFFDTAIRQWMGTSQISICIVFLVIYFSILSLQQMMEVRQNSKDNQIMRCMGKSNKQIARLMNQQIAIKLSSPMIMALLIIIFCIPLLNGKMNLILPASIMTGYNASCNGIFTTENEENL